MQNIYWKWKSFHELSNEEIFDIFAVRQTVFVVEQDCPYQDVDQLDKTSFHLMGKDKAGQIIAYARLNPPGSRFKEPSIGRVLAIRSSRGSGLGRQIVKETLSKCIQLYQGFDIRISAQVYLINFYGEFGFISQGEAYDEDGIEHIDMVKSNC